MVDECDVCFITQKSIFLSQGRNWPPYHWGGGSLCQKLTSWNFFKLSQLWVIEKIELILFVIFVTVWNFSSKSLFFFAFPLPCCLSLALRYSLSLAVFLTCFEWIVKCYCMFNKYRCCSDSSLTQSLLPSVASMLYCIKYRHGFGNFL